MNKKISCLMVIFLMLPICFAEYQDITNNINVTVSGNQLNIKGEGLNYATTLSCNSTNFNQPITQSWKENVTCNTDMILWQQEVALANMSNMIFELKDQIHYYELYADCKDNLTEYKNYKNNNEDKNIKLSSCLSYTQNLEGDISDYKLRMKSYNTTLYESNQEIEDLAGQRNMGWFFAIVGSGIAIYLYVKKVKPQDSRKKDINNGIGRW